MTKEQRLLLRDFGRFEKRFVSLGGLIVVIISILMMYPVLMILRELLMYSLIVSVTYRWLEERFIFGGGG